MDRLNKYVSYFTNKENDEALVVFNALTGGIYLLTNPVKEKFLSFCDDGNQTFAPEVRDFLLSRTIIVSEKVDELELVKEQYQRAFEATDELHVTYCLTNRCNLACSYCYQDHNAESMGTKAMDKSIRHIATRLPNFKSLKVHWFGGEPLLNMELIAYATPILKKLAHSLGVVFESEMTTNGTLLDDRTASFLKKHQVKRIQFTLDGKQDIHDELRVYKSGKGSFIRIIEAMKTSVAHKISTLLRLNISKRNYKSINQLLDFLITNDLGPDKLFLYVNELKNHGSSKFEDDLYFESEEAFAHSLVSVMATLQRYGYPIPKMQPIGINCIFDKPSTLFFGTDGNLYHCTTETNKLMAVVREDGSLRNRTDLMKWAHERRPWCDDECADCKHLPLCMGGCAYLEKEGKLKCNPSVFELESMINLTINQQQKEQENG